MVLTVARFTAQKGHGVLLQAMRLHSAYHKPCFSWSAMGPTKQLSKLSHNSESENVSFWAAPDVPDLLAAADLFVLPSLFEGLPLVVLEAMALALPVVATRIGGTVEALGSDHPFLVPAGEPSLLAAAIVAALSDDDLRRAVGRKQKSGLKSGSPHRAWVRKRQHFTRARKKDWIAMSGASERLRIGFIGAGGIAGAISTSCAGCPMSRSSRSPIRISAARLRSPTSWGRRPTIATVTS